MIIGTFEKKEKKGIFNSTSCPVVWKERKTSTKENVGTDIGEWTGKSVVTYIREAKNRERWQKIADSSKCPNGHQATGVT